MEGTRLGPYQILAELGSGGMGKVYRAEVTRASAGLAAGTAVALKVIHAHLLEQEGFFKRFLREAQIGQAVDHENVVRCFDCDATLLDGASQHYLVMEYVEGQTLRDLLVDLDRVPEELCRHIGREAAKGLAAIHQAGVVHRDLKPENVLITEDHVVKVMDLGVARLQDEAIRLSQAGTFVGSLEYAAPEQFRSSDGEPDGRADLHSLGLLLYELSTGQHPYRDEDVSKVLHRILEETPRRAGELNPQLSPFFEEVVQKLVAKERDKRFGEASDLALVLEEGEKSNWWKERAKALRIETKRPLRRIRIPRETALYGRDGDLSTLRGLYERAKAGEGQVLLLEGEAGIGKTRLVDEFVGRLREDGEDLNFLFGSYPPSGAATASGGISEAFREQFGQEGAAGWLTQTPLLVPAFEALLRGEPPPEGAQPLTPESIGTVFVHATRNLAAERPTIVLIDDLHFAPEDARSLFAMLALAVPGHRVLLVGTMRPGIDEAWTSNLVRLDQISHASLSRLGPKDLVRLLRDSFKSERVAHELGTQIALKSDGNPFFAFEIIRGLREGQFITQKPDGTWVTTQVIEDIEIPSSVLDLVSARIADLTQDERDLLDVAACWGFEFDPLLLGDVLGVGRIPLLKRLGQIERRHRLVRSAGLHYVFDHHQVQEALYGSLSELLRREYHAALAEALEAREGAAGRDPEDLDGSLLVDLCEHYLKGARGEKALRYLDASLSHLATGYLNDQAVSLADLALAVPGLLEGGARIGVLLRRNDRLESLGRPKIQEAGLTEALELATRGNDRAASMQIERALGVLRFTTGRCAEAQEHFERSSSIARELGDRKSEGATTGGLGQVFHALGRYTEAREHQEHWLSIARDLGDRRSELRAIGSLGGVFRILGRYREAREHHERALEIAREIGDRRGESDAMGSLGIVFAEMGRHEQAKPYYESQLSICREIGYRRGEAMGIGNLGNVFASLGRYREACVHYERHRSIAREIGDRFGEGIATGNLGGVFALLGRHREAREHLEDRLAIAKEIGEPWLRAVGLFELASVAQLEGDGALALGLALEALDLRRETRDGGGVADSLVQLGGIHLEAGRDAEAVGALEEALGLLREQQRGDELALALRARLPGGDAAAAERALVESDGPAVRYHLWKATGKPEHLAEAKRLLDYRVEHAPEAYRESMLNDVQLNREIMEAWAQHGEG